MTPAMCQPIDHQWQGNTSSSAYSRLCHPLTTWHCVDGCSDVLGKRCGDLITTLFYLAVLFVRPAGVLLPLCSSGFEMCPQSYFRRRTAAPRCSLPTCYLGEYVCESHLFIGKFGIFVYCSIVSCGIVWDVVPRRLSWVPIR
jgi:hypothetical protein